MLWQINDDDRGTPVGNPRLQSRLNVLVVTPDDYLNRFWTLKTVAFDTAPGSSQNLDAFADGIQIIVVDERIFQREHFGQGTDQFDFVCFH